MESVNIPDNVKRIGSWAFQKCKNLVRMVIPNGVQEIGYRAFEECQNLKAVEIPSSVEKIDSDAFEDCDKLTIYAPAGSFAERYARLNNIKFAVLPE